MNTLTKLFFHQPKFLPSIFLTLNLASANANNTIDTQAIHKTLGERIGQLEKIDEITPTAMQNLFEVRIGKNIFYTDSKGDFLIIGELVDTKTHRNITEKRVQALNAINFDQLPLQDAMKIVRGDGSRKIAIFEDPNCGYCKKFEQDLKNVNNITAYIFLYPILGSKSIDLSRDIWCAKKPAEAWQNWMTKNVTPSDKSSCQKTEALQRNIVFGREHQITGTPTIFFTDGTRMPGAVPIQEIEQKLQTLATQKS